MWEGISRPGNGRDGIGGKEIKILIPGDVPGRVGVGSGRDGRPPIVLP